MKKILILALAFAIFAFCLTSCSDLGGGGGSEINNGTQTDGETDNNVNENGGTDNDSANEEVKNEGSQNSGTVDNTNQGTTTDPEQGNSDSDEGEETEPGVSGGSEGEEGNGGENTVVNNNVVLAFSDVTIAIGREYQLSKTVTVNGEEKNLTYAVDNGNVTITDCKLVATASVRQATVTAEAENFKATFTIKAVNIGDLVMNDVSVSVGDTVSLTPDFTSVAGESDVTYTFEGNNIKIENGSVTALVADSVTVVTAVTKYHKATFTVTVLPDDVGKMTVTSPDKIYSNYAPKDITVSFSDERFASDVTYSCSTPNVFVENGKIWATGTFSSEVDANVVVKSKYHTETVTVKVSTFNVNSAETKIAYYETLMTEENKGGIIFIGDSYFDGYPKSDTGLPPFWSDFYTDYANEKAFLMGISSSQIDTWELAIERVVFPMEPKEIVLHIGFNDAHHSENSAYNISSRIIAVLERIHEKLPDTKIYYCSVEPKKNAMISDQYSESSLVKAPMINAIMEAYAIEESSWVKFVNTRELCFNGDGSINQSFYINDLSHPSLDSYDKYRNLIEIARGNIEEAPTPEDTIKEISENQTSVNTAAAAAKENTEVYTIENFANQNGQTLAKYFTLANGSALTNYYSISGYMTISNLDYEGAHVQFRFSNTTSDRFLLYDSNSNKKLGICAPFEKISSESSPGAFADAIDASSSATVKWQVVVTESTAYFYINDVLVLYGNPGALSYFNISVQKADISFWGVELVAKAENETSYNTIVTKLKLN